ncbi:MAG TPA: Bax inhibitor-1 family protein [Ktedonobacterales bacterium]|nr:Bax inhibitor-1 family protein [Ktedonobacterales bacterium]
MRNSPYGGYGYQPSQYGGYGAAAGAAFQSLLSKVLTLLSLSMLTAGVGLAVGWQLIRSGDIGFLFPAIILEFVVLIALMITGRVLKRAAALNLLLLFAFTFISGLTISAVIAAYVAIGAETAVAEALVLTGVLTVGLGMYAWTTRRNLSRLGPILFVGLLTLVVASIFSIFLSFGWLSFAIAVGGVVIFSGYILYDIQRIKYTENTLAAAILLTVSLYLDIINLFLSLLRLLGGGRRS